MITLEVLDRQAHVLEGCRSLRHHVSVNKDTLPRKRAIELLLTVYDWLIASEQAWVDAVRSRENGGL